MRSKKRKGEKRDKKKEAGTVIPSLKAEKKKKQKKTVQEPIITGRLGESVSFSVAGEGSLPPDGLPRHGLARSQRLHY